MAEFRSDKTIDLVQLGHSLASFENAVDQHCFSGTIDRCSNQWWVQFITIAGEKTMPAIESSLPNAIDSALRRLSEILPDQQKELHV